MSESAESLAANQQSSRNVTIEICNHTLNFCLLDPKVYLKSGSCHSPPQPIVRPNKVEVCNFSKTSAKATGAVGVLTYDVLERGGREAKERLAVMFSVPYSNTLYKNWVAVGFFDLQKKCDDDLFEEMYNKESKLFKRQEANGSCLIHDGKILDIMVTMSPLGRAIMKLEVHQRSVWDETPSRSDPW